jgi:hypothetical protein
MIVRSDSKMRTGRGRFRRRHWNNNAQQEFYTEQTKGNVMTFDRNDSMRDAPVKTGVRAKQGDRRTVTLWILVVSVILAAIVGWILIAGTEEYTADQPDPVEEGSNPQSPPLVPGTQPT